MGGSCMYFQGANMKEILRGFGIAGLWAAAASVAGCGGMHSKAAAPPIVGGACQYADHPGTFEVTRRVPYLGSVTDVYFTYRPLDDAKPLDSDTTLHQRFNSGVPEAGTLFGGVRHDETSGTCTPLIYNIQFGDQQLSPVFGPP